MAKKIRLLSTFNNLPPNSIITLDDATADKLLAGGIGATLDLTGGVVRYLDGDASIESSSVTAPQRVTISVPPGSALTLNGSGGAQATLEILSATGAVLVSRTIGNGPNGPLPGGRTYRVAVDSGTFNSSMKDADEVRSQVPRFDVLEKVPLPTWRAAMGRLRNNVLLPNGAGNPKIGFVGSSSYTGYGAASTTYNTSTGLAAGGREKNIVAKLAAMLNAYFAPAQAHSFFGASGEFTGTRAALLAFDPRIAVDGTGWGMDDPGRTANPPTNPFPVGGTYFVNNGTVDQFRFTPAGDVDSFEVFRHQTSGSGTLGVLIDAEAKANITPQGAGVDPAMRSFTFNTATPGTHTLKLTPTAAGQINSIHAVRAWNSTRAEIELWQMGVPGSTANEWLRAYDYRSTGNTLGTIYKADLWVIDLARNSWIGNESLADFRDRTQQLINNCKRSGDVILVAGAPSSSALELQQPYVDAYAELARDNNLIFVDMWRHFGGFSSTNNLYSDNIHLGGNGYGLYAQALFNAITQA